MRKFSFLRTKDSFTLVELLVVIGILAILTAAVVIVLNPAELLKQSRDSKRTTDLAAVNNALKILLTQSPDVSLGAASTVYISLADSSSTCGSYALPALPSGWKYQCVATANLTKIDASGWIPVNFSNGASQLPALPTDPQNDAVARKYYAYAASNGKWELASSFESAKYAAKEANDGGADPAEYEVGSALDVISFVNGLVGYWPFEEGSGTATADKSGSGNNGVLTNGPAWQASNCRTGKCLSFDGADDYVLVANSASLATPNALTISAWINRADLASYKGIAAKYGTINTEGYYALHTNGSAFRIEGSDVGSNTRYANFIAGTSSTGAWMHVATVYDGSQFVLFSNGSRVASYAWSYGLGSNSAALKLGAFWAGSFNGQLDEIRIYNRALSAAEIQAIYNAAQ